MRLLIRNALVPLLSLAHCTQSPIPADSPQAQVRTPDIDDAAARPDPGISHFWDSLGSIGESSFFASWNDGEAPWSELLFVPNAPPTLRSANLERTYELGRDFVWEPGSRRITLTPDSRIPSRRCAELYPPKGAPNSIGESRVGPTALLWSEGHFFHDLQVTASYTPSEIDPGLAMPNPSLGRLPHSLARLHAKQPFHLVVLGDSISEGYNASAFTDAAPHQGAYPQLVADDLTARFGSAVTLTNLSRAGTTSAWGKDQASAVAKERPDLVIVAFGMNDAGGTPPETYAANIHAILDTIRTTNPTCEFVLVASMLGNPEFAALDPARFPAFRDELKKLERDGVVLADLTELWTRMLTRKRFLDLTGNGVNHPNDFGHRLYAAVIGDRIRG